MDGHLDLISDTDEEEASLSAVDSDLADELIEALSEQLFTEGANSSFSCLASLQGGIKIVLQIDNVNLSGGLWRYVTHPQ